MSLSSEQRALIVQFLRKQGAITQPDLPSIDTAPLQRELFPLQSEILAHPAKRKALLCGRRFSKTYLVAVALIKSALSSSNSNSLFIATSKAHAKRLIWKQLQAFNKQYNLQGIFKSSFVDLSVEFPNNSKITLSGCNHRGDAESFRGDKYQCVVVDEAGSEDYLDHLEYLIEEVLDPALQDTDGELWLAGTPNSLSEGYFHTITNTKDTRGFITFTGTVLENPKFPRWSGKSNWKKEALLWWDQYKKKKGWKEDNPILKREWLGIWPGISSRIVLPVTTDNYTDSIPTNLNYVIGVDTGFHDKFAIVVTGSADNSPYFYVIESFQEAKLGYSKVLAKIQELYDKYDPDLIVVDPADAGRHIVEELATDFNLPIEIAEKHDRVNFIDYFADDFRTNKVLISDDLTELYDELEAVKWKDKRKGKFVRPKDGHNDLFDACFYAWRHSPHRQYEPEIDIPLITDAKYFDDGHYERALIKKLEEQDARETGEWLDMVDDDDY